MALGRSKTTLHDIHRPSTKASSQRAGPKTSLRVTKSQYTPRWQDTIQQTRAKQEHLRSSMASKSSRKSVVNSARDGSKLTDKKGSQRLHDHIGEAENSAKSTNKQSVGKVAEKRLKRYRGQPPQTFLEKLERAQNQRMIVIGRKKIGSDEYPSEEIDIVGSTGNIYTVTIGQVPSCTCPDHIKGHECKHKVYAMHTVLKAPYHLQYQLAFLSSELCEIFANAPPLPNEVLNEDNNGKRKSVDGDCPICFMNLDEKENNLVWCKAGCGNNIHKSCFDQWTKFQSGGQIRCVLCRAIWEVDGTELEAIAKKGKIGDEGYINVAEHFGLSGARDYSSYYQGWVRSRFGMGS